MILERVCNKHVEISLVRYAIYALSINKNIHSMFIKHFLIKIIYTAKRQYKQNAMHVFRYKCRICLYVH